MKGPMSCIYARLYCPATYTIQGKQISISCLTDSEPGCCRYYRIHVRSCVSYWHMGRTAAVQPHGSCWSGQLSSQLGQRLEPQLLDLTPAGRGCSAPASHALHEAR